MRSRHWRLAALLLWAVILLANLGAAFDIQAATLADDGDIHSMCLASGGPDHPAPPASAPHHAGGPHCPLCYVFAAGVLTPPTAIQLLVLTPQSGWAGPTADVLAPPRTAAALSEARPRAPPAFV
ncbi:MAG: DUF2946 domain-containing protein [Magnetospirillum sp.]|nr:DUF2946 domain-containing protein [Magnetospirillum sp.]